MALRLFNKITSTFSSNLIQVFGPRSLIHSTATVCNINQDKEEKNASNNEEDKQTQLSHANTKYKTYNVREHSKVSFPDLQPAALPDYFNPNQNFEKHVPAIEKTIVETNTSATRRVFEASTTYKNVKLPLKQPRLAKPFPDPVKMMASDTISDDEKARQMQSDARYPGHSKPKKFNNMNFNPQYRSFATKSGKCGKKCKPKKKQCDRIRSRNCPQVQVECACTYTSTKKPCTKQRAPYPSYSETCHTVLDSYPNECQMCPWTPRTHPTFKVKKSKYHTSVITFSPKGRDFEKWLHNVDQNRGWVQEKKTVKSEKHKNNRKLSEINKKIEIPKSKNQFKFYHKENFPTKSKKKNAIDQIGDPIIVQNLPSASNTSSVPYFLYSETKRGIDDAMEIKNLKKIDKRQSKRRMLPFVSPKSKAKAVMYKPKKAVERIDQDWSKEDTPTINITINYFMAKKKDRSVPPGTRDKCPDLDPVGDDPCNLKRKGITQECPKDLLIKKRRPIKPPKKKCSPINPQKPNNPDIPNF